MIPADITWSEYWSPIRLSLQVALLASVIAIVLGTLVAWCMSRRLQFRGKTVLETVFMLPLVLPPTVVGFLLLMLLGRRSWLGRTIERIFDSPVIFTWWAAVIAAVVVAFPLIYRTTVTGFEAVDRDLEDAGRSIGANEWQVFRHITLPLIFPSLKTAYVLGFARSLGEFGATLMIAGNIPGRTQTVPTAIYVAVDSGHLSQAWAWTVAIVAISFVLLLLTGRRSS
ncbi:molybdate ABC transporter permease subunit [Saccharibacillus sp. CPCC 101409]|uniref:molybdate ABC transporter permease subunit n=1 Tax=Saccharibacillus sp. CPCC 101409 TaxID=3058041 RepID=UPI002673BF33|nr:molybdate ABC transporter permease subunit [Saccharibacillus sp. CPCC 101409]MDO3412336.1 molybdate ABC transporter permease subunit [Saccharibacillus sp. CPCC 101409]